LASAALDMPAIASPAKALRIMVFMTQSFP
jgi:hypothetical protein